jgi:glyoxylase-like metal-dependent hydrolase (beta-lactamase superfamily II)
MKIIPLCPASWGSNCYLLTEGEHALLIDPSASAEAIGQALAKEGAVLDAVLLTHGHFDHVGAVESIVKATGCALWMHQGDYSQFKNPTNAFFYPLANSDFTEIQFCEEAETIHAGGLDFTVWETPGHTWGSVCYLCEDAMFCGDTLFAGACGRIDLPGGDRAAMVNSLERLAEMATDYRVFPGHGGSSTLFREQQTNPYLGGCL